VPTGEIQESGGGDEPGRWGKARFLVVGRLYRYTLAQILKEARTAQYGCVQGGEGSAAANEPLWVNSG